MNLNNHVTHVYEKSSKNSQPTLTETFDDL